MTEPLTEEQIQMAWISHLKSLPAITSLMTGVSGTEIRESNWQGGDYTYPAIRVYVDTFPSVNGCGPDTAQITTCVFSEQKSSLEAKHISGTLVKNVHKKRFTSNGVTFEMVRVTKTTKSERSIYAWQSDVVCECLVY